MNRIVHESRRQRALGELLVASANLAADPVLEEWCLKTPTGHVVWAAVQMLRDSVKEYDKYDQ